MTKKKNSAMKVRVPGAKKSVDKMKYEIANEFGVTIGANSSSRTNGKVGGEVTKRLVENGKKKTNSKRSKKTTTNK